MEKLAHKRYADFSNAFLFQGKEIKALRKVIINGEEYNVETKIEYPKYFWPYYPIIIDFIITKEIFGMMIPFHLYDIVDKVDVVPVDFDFNEML